MKQQIISRGGASNAATSRQHKRRAAKQFSLFGRETKKRKRYKTQPKADRRLSQQSGLKGCSENAEHYRTTIETMVVSINKGIRHIPDGGFGRFLSE